MIPAAAWSEDPRSPGVKCRHDLAEGGVSRSIKNAVRESGIDKKVSAHTLRHSYAMRLLQKRVDLRTIIPPSSGSAKWLRGRSRQALRAGQSGGVGALECEGDGDLYACGACDGGRGEEFAG